MMKSAGTNHIVEPDLNNEHDIIHTVLTVDYSAQLQSHQKHMWRIQATMMFSMIERLESKVTKSLI